MGLLDDYRQQAQTYDHTRGVSDSVARPLMKALAAAPGPRVADVGGGTGNYAAHMAATGFDPLVVDRSPEMLAVARSKGLKTLEADAAALPLPAESFDAVTLISMLHHVEQPGLAVAEARRIAAAGGVLFVMAFTREDIEAMWVLDYFPSSRTWMRERHDPRGELLADLPGAAVEGIALDDLADASLAALLRRPDLVLDAAWRRQTSYFERMERDHPGELREGLAPLRADLEHGRVEAEAGKATLVVWSKPAG